MPRRFSAVGGRRHRRALARRADARPASSVAYGATTNAAHETSYGGGRRRGHGRFAQREHEAAAAVDEGHECLPTRETDDGEAHDRRHLQDAMHHLFDGHDDARRGRVTEIGRNGQLVKHDERRDRADRGCVDVKKERAEHDARAFGQLRDMHQRPLHARVVREVGSPVTERVGGAGGKPFRENAIEQVLLRDFHKPLGQLSPEQERYHASIWRRARCNAASKRAK